MKEKKQDKDVPIIQRVLDGNTEEFRFLIQKYQDLSYSLACSILKNEFEAEEATHEAFIKVYKKLNTFNQQASFSTWLYRIVVNTALNRRSGFRKQTALQEHSVPHSSSENEGLARMADQDRKYHVNKTLDSLKSDEALMLRLFYLADLSVSEIKEVTGYSASKIKVTLHRARNSMQQALELSLGNELNYLL